MVERFFNKISNGNQKGRKLAESEEDKRQMLNNIKSKHLLEIYRKKAESKKQEERSDQSIFDDTSSTETDYTETIPSNASDVEDFASQYGSYAFYSVRFED